MVVGVVEEHVALIGHLRLARIEGLADVEERLTHLVLHVDQVDRLECCGLVDSRHAADELALEAHLALGQVRLVRRDAERLEVAHDGLRHVPVRRHREHAGVRLRRGVDADDARCGAASAGPCRPAPRNRLVGHVPVRPVTCAPS
jgi:hypothetical protein